MTTITDDRIRALLTDAAGRLEPSPAAARAILDAASAELGDDGDVAPRASRRRRTVRVALAVAAAVLLATAAVLAFSDRNHVGFTPDQQAGGLRVQGGVASPNGFTTLRPTDTRNVSGDYAAFGAASPFSNTVSGHDNAGSQQPSAAPTTAGTQPARVVATGTVTITVPQARLQPVVTSMSALATREGGYVASAVVHTRASGGAASATIVLRVPERRFASLVAAVQHEGTTTSVSTSSSDVTGEVVNYQARIAAAEASRTQYLAILAKATSISAILSVQSQIDSIQSEIEQLQGARNVLVNEAAYSTLSVSVDHATTAQGPESGIRHSWLLGVGGFVSAFELLIRAAGPALFILLCLAVVALVGRVVWRSTRRRML